MTDRIIIDPTIHFGKPCVAGTRIPAHAVLELIRDGINFDEIATGYYPNLTVADIQACVQYALDLIAQDQQAKMPSFSLEGSVIRTDQPFDPVATDV